MKFTLALLGALLSVAAAIPYTPPTDQPDGAYLVQFDERGNPTTKRFETSALDRRDPEPEPAVPAPISLAKRNFPGNPGASCGTRGIPTDGSYSVVQNCLGTWLRQKNGQSLQANGSGNNSGVYYCRNKDTLLAICFYNYNAIAGSAAEIDTFNAEMDRQCGAWHSGYIFIKNWNKTYWRTTWGEEVCANIYGDSARMQVFA